MNHYNSFIFNENIEPTNNHAEQSLRSAVIWRKTF
ncbi:TPA: transposase [Legionella pneumophila]|nr:transposase [Legionella pneumophila]HAT6919704.1 transposase [Legionella pneumophila]HAT6972344.1 transposase [Legionella pneumophila]HAU3861515.1 transposase [Legionella pneumophila]HAU4219334.1 transposase [Legionella pneumophila]